MVLLVTALGTEQREGNGKRVASVEKYEDTGGRERYAARWREGRKQVKARRDADGLPFKSARAAMKYAQDQESDARRGRNPHRTDVTVAEYARYWLTTRSHRPTTLERLRYSFKHFEATGLADRKLTEVRQSQVQAWVSDRAGVLAPSTLRKVLNDLGAVFRTAVHDNVIVKTPVVNLRLPEHDDVAHMIPLTVADVEALAAAMPARYRAMVIVQAGLGLRAGELLGLRVADVDPLRRQASVVEQRTRVTPQLRTEPKTRWSKRTVPLPQRVADELVRHVQAYAHGEDLFTTSTGRVPHASHYGGMIAAAARKAGLPDGVASHDLRHHYATELLGAGLTSVEVGHLLGHRDGSLVEKVYGHSRVDAADRARAALDALYAS